MSGRAGRKGLTTTGESIVICRPNELNAVMRLIDSKLTVTVSQHPSRHGGGSSGPVPSTSIGSSFTPGSVMTNENTIQRLILVRYQKHSEF